MYGTQEHVEDVRVISNSKWAHSYLLSDGKATWDAKCLLFNIDHCQKSILNFSWVKNETKNVLNIIKAEIYNVQLVIAWG